MEEKSSVGGRRQMGGSGGEYLLSERVQWEQEEVNNARETQGKGKNPWESFSGHCVGKWQAWVEDA